MRITQCLHNSLLEFYISFSPLSKASSSGQSSAFAQYKGELVVSLKYVSAKNPAIDKTKGKILF